MATADLIRTLLPYAVAFALTHLIVLPFKSFFLKGDLHRMAVRATLWNLLAVGYVAAVVFLFGGESPSVLWGVVKYLPTLVIFAYSVAVWLYIMVRATRKYMLIDVAVFTILALAAS